MKSTAIVKAKKKRSKLTMGLAFVGAVGGTIATGGLGGLVIGAAAGGAGGNYAGKKHVKKVKKRMDGV